MQSRHPIPSFDARPLTEPVDKADVRAFAADLKARGNTGSSIGPGVAVFLIALVVLMFLVGSVFMGLIGSWISSGDMLMGLPFLPILLGVIAVIIVIVTVVLGRGRRQERWYRLDRFARANAMEYVPHVKAPRLPGMIFHLGRDRKSRDLVRGGRPRFVEFGNYEYTTGSGKSETTHKWGYVAVKLDVPLPHIVLDAVGNNGLFGSSNLPTSFTREQRLSLEGDFDRHFALYCPAGYERDALYLFTPDIMARFIDNVAALDVEIVDDWLFLYAKREFSTLDPATWAWLFAVVRALLDKLAQWARWRDERLARADAGVRADAASALPFAAPAQALTPPPGVAAPGRRLRRGTSWGVIIVIGIGVVFFALNIAQAFF